MKPDPQVITELVRRITEVSHPLRIILFGSAAREDMRPDSDLDILVVVPDGQHRGKTVATIYRNLIGFGIPVDVVAATETDLKNYAHNFSTVYHSALKEGKQIYAG